MGVMGSFPGSPQKGPRIFHEKNYYQLQLLGNW